MKKLYDISWQVTEPEYREDPALSFSTISKFEREGFNGLPKLFDKIESPSLVFGSAVDAVITGGMEEFYSHFKVLDTELPQDSIKAVVEALYNDFGTVQDTLTKIPDSEILSKADALNYQTNWKPSTRIDKIRDKGTKYYKLLKNSEGKQLVDKDFYDRVMLSVSALRTNESTGFYFAPDNPFNDDYQREYQLKFKATFDGIDYRCMADLLLVCHSKKIVYPVDLKTSGKPEWDFYKSFVEFNYSNQARLYWRIIRHNMDKDEMYKDYKLADYRFIVVNYRTLMPLVWEFPDTTKTGTLTYGKEGKVEMKDPFDTAKELSYYLKNKPLVPVGVKTSDRNNLNLWLDTM